MFCCIHQFWEINLMNFMYSDFDNSKNAPLDFLNFIGHA